MNKFEAKNIHSASEYLQSKLNVFKKVEKSAIGKENVYVLEEKKASGFKKFIYSLFKSQ